MAQGKTSLWVIGFPFTAYLTADLLTIGTNQQKPPMTADFHFCQMSQAQQPQLDELLLGIAPSAAQKLFKHPNSSPPNPAR